MYAKVVVLCRNSNGETEFFTCTPDATEYQINTGEHYDLAKECAANNGFENPMIAFDANDVAARQLGDVLAWI